MGQELGVTVLPSGYLLVRKIRCLNKTPVINISKPLVEAKRRRRRKMESLNLRGKRQFRRPSKGNKRNSALAQRISRIVERKEKKKEPREKRVIQWRKLLRLVSEMMKIEEQEEEVVGEGIEEREEEGEETEKI